VQQQLVSKVERKRVHINHVASKAIASRTKLRIRLQRLQTRILVAYRESFRILIVRHVVELLVLREGERGDGT
jgi:hypothetical protein